MKRIRRCLAVLSIILGGSAVAIPDIVISKFLITLATSLNAAAIYLLKEEKIDENSTPGS